MAIIVDWTIFCCCSLETLSLISDYFYTGALDTYIGEVMIEGNATMDISGFVSEFISLTTGTATIVDAELIGGECKILCEILD